VYKYLAVGQTFIILIFEW